MLKCPKCGYEFEKDKEKPVRKIYCPFCGKEGEILKTDASLLVHISDEKYIIRCKSCGFDFVIGKIFKSPLWKSLEGFKKG